RWAGRPSCRTAPTAWPATRAAPCWPRAPSACASMRPFPSGTCAAWRSPPAARRSVPRRHTMRIAADPGAARRAAGLGLIEVLVAVAILAFGLLGLAAMQATTLRNNQSASERSEAAIATYAILERMRANYQVAANGGYDLAAMTCNPPTGTDLVTRDQRDWI